MWEIYNGSNSLLGRDGRNYTARAIYPCWYDPDNPDFVVINFDPDKTLMLLIFFAAIPGGILTFSCLYMCGCSRFIFVGDDGHMRLKCCGKAVTGIGKKNWIRFHSKLGQT